MNRRGLCWVLSAARQQRSTQKNGIELDSAPGVDAILSLKVINPPGLLIREFYNKFDNAWKLIYENEQRMSEVGARQFEPADMRSPIFAENATYTKCFIPSVALPGAKLRGVRQGLGPRHCRSPRAHRKAISKARPLHGPQPLHLFRE